MVVITSIFFIFILTISCITYLYTVQRVQEEFNNTRLQAEKTFVSSVILTEYGVASFDAQYDFLLHDRILTFSRVYNTSRDDPFSIDLKSLKREISPGAPGEIELFIIDKRGIVEATTYEKDYRLDFSEFPDFFASLDTFRQGNEFKADPWIRDFSDPHLYWKYGYLPTGDHEYILEIGLKNENYSRIHQNLITNLRSISREALNIQNLEYAEVYDKAHRKQTYWSGSSRKNISSCTGLLSPGELESVLNRTFGTKTSFLMENPGKNQVISVQYINLSNTGSFSGAERSYVGIQVFSTKSVEATIQGYRTGFILVTLISLMIGLIIALYLSAYISRPIEMMTEDVGIIVSSSLAHSVRSTGLDETERLRSSINHLVAYIKDHVHAIESRDKALETELNLRKRAELSLSKANKRMIQLSQITRHDILNQVTALKGYLELIPDAKEKSEVDEYSRRASLVLDKIILHLKFTYDYEKIGQEGAVWQNIGQVLDQIRDEFAGQIAIVHSCYNIEILADPLIKKVFYNLVDNSVRHGDTAGRVRVFFEEREEYGCLVYEDNGSGIPGEFKQRIFERGFGKGTGLGLAFIREALESNDLIIAENGVPGKGARFVITIPPDHYRIK